MGTNYYMLSNNQTECPHCGQLHKEKVHIGKASAGWQFVFQAHKDVRNINDWRLKLKHSHIIDEYDNDISYDDFFSMVDSRRDLQSHYEYVSNRYGSSIHRCYLDYEGHSFTDGDFS